MRRRPIGYRIAGMLAVTGLLMACTGCVVDERTTRSSKIVVPEGEAFENIERHADLPDAALIKQTSIASAISVEALGSIEYDGFTLPIACPTPGSSLIAIQTGRRPTWDVLLARSSAGTGSHGVAIYRLEAQKTPELVAEYTGGYLLGRVANQQGVLIEHPRPDGARWIGLAPWDGGEIEWLKSDENINAFAWITEDSTLAYAQRTPEETYFELVVRRPDGNTWRLEEPLPYSWILPVLDPDGDGLYALRLGEGFADIAWGRLDGEAAFRDSLALHRVSDRIDGRRAWQILAATTGGAGTSTKDIAWFSFELARLVLWNPRTGDIELLPPQTVAACTREDEREWFVTTSGKFMQAVLLETRTATNILLDQPWIARPGGEGDVIVVLAKSGKLELGRIWVAPLNNK